MSTALKMGQISIKLANAALIALERGDETNATLLARRAADALAVAKALGWQPDTSKLPSPESK